MRIRTSARKAATMMLALGMLLSITSTAQADVIIASFSFSGNANDGTLNGHDGTVNGATLTQDRFGNADSAYFFNGSADIVVPNSPAFNGLPALTMEAWVRPATGITEYDIIVNKEWQYEMAWLDGGLASAVNTSSSGWTWYAGASGLQIGKWSYVVVTWNGSVVSRYVDGVLGATNSQAGILASDRGDPLLIGARSAGLGYYYFNGAIDDVALYATALTADEVRARYNATSVPEPTSLLLLGTGLVGAARAWRKRKA